MSNDPSISILITYYNEREMLSSCLESLRGQVNADDEILIYDDASAFSPEPYIPEGVSVRIIRGNRNIGPGAGRNRLLNEATGDFVHFHDSDDWFHPDWRSAVRSRLTEGDVDLLITEVASSSIGIPSFEKPIMELAELKSCSDLISYAINHVLLVPSGTFRRACALRIHGFREALWQSEDKDFYIRLAASGVKWTVDGRPLVCIRNRADSRSKQGVEVWRDGLKCLELASHELPLLYNRDIADAAARTASQLLLLGQREAFETALNLVNEMGGSNYWWRSHSFRLLRRLVGVELAECASARWQLLKTIANPMNRHSR